MFGDALGKKNVDRIIDFQPKIDRIQLDREIFKPLKASDLKEGKLSMSEFHLGNEAQDKNDHILYDQKTGKLYFDIDGSGKKAAVEFAVLENKPANVSHHDFYII
jgi:Ca2+-binding RTX toxin-like protein